MTNIYEKVFQNPERAVAIALGYYPAYPESLTSYYFCTIEEFMNPLSNGVIYGALNNDHHREFETIENIYLNAFRRETAITPHVYSDGFPGVGESGLKRPSIRTRTTFATVSLSDLMWWALRVGAGSIAVAMPDKVMEPHGNYVWHGRGLGSQVMQGSKNPALASDFVPFNDYYPLSLSKAAP